MIPELINKRDNFEVIRDRIAVLLKTEVESQKALAVVAGEDPGLWDLRVFIERSNPWEQYLNDDDFDTRPIINVWYDNSNFDSKASNSVERQKTTGVFNVDCYGYGQSEDDPTGGHVAGDQDAAEEVHRALRLVRNILMAGEYTYLGLRGLVWARWPQSVTIFQPQLDAHQVQQVVGARLALQVVFNEFSPQVAESELCGVSVEIKRAETGEVIADADYDYTED